MLFCALSLCLGLHLQAQPSPEATTESFRIQTDPRVELIALVQRMSGSPEYRQAAGNEYLKALDKHFEPFAEHPVMASTRELRKDYSIAFDAPMSLALHLDSQFRLRVPLQPWPDGLDERWQGSNLPKYLQELKDFAEKSDFQAFWNEQQNHFQSLESACHQAFHDRQPDRWYLNSFGGAHAVSFRAVPTYLTGPMSFGVSMRNQGRLQESWQILGFHQMDAQGKPVAGESLEALLTHEMGHAFANPLVDAFGDSVDLYSNPLFAADEATFQRQAYGSGRIVAYESLVRAMVVSYLRREVSQAEAWQQARDDQMRGFGWVPELSALLETFLDRKDRSQSIQDFFPQIIALFKNRAEAIGKPGVDQFLGPVNGAIFGSRGSKALAVVLPPVAEPAHAYLKQMASRFFKAHGAQILESGSLDQAQAGERHLLLYGCPNTQPLLQKAFEKLNWRLDDQGLAFGKRQFSGNNLVVIACHPNPFGRGSLLVYAASDPAYLDGIHNLSHGPNDYVVGQFVQQGQLRMIAKGDFPKQGPTFQWQNPPATEPATSD